jgi:hypothetical protein
MLLVPLTLLSSFLWITFLKELCYLPEIINHPSPKLSSHFHRPFLTTFWPLFPFWKYGPIEITISINFHTANWKKRSTNGSQFWQKNGSHLKYSKYGAFALWIPESRSRSPWTFLFTYSWWWRYTSHLIRHYVTYCDIFAQCKRNVHY